MKRYKAALLGCGRRSDAHAEAYAHLPRAEFTAACSRDADLRERFCATFGGLRGYAELTTMLQREQPDILHVVTHPRTRVEILTLASEMGVPAVIVEKPIAMQGEDWAQIDALAKRSSTRFVVNTQLHFHPRNVQLREDVLNGRIGDCLLIDASARSTPVNQGPHVLQLICGYLDHARPRCVAAQAFGKRALTGDGELSPDNVLASVTYDNGVRAMISLGADIAPPASQRDSVFLHKRIAVHGTRGFVHWSMYDWQRMTAEHGLEQGEHDYIAENEQAQVALTQSVIDWLDDEHHVAPTNLSRACDTFNLLLGIYESAVTRRPVTLPCDPPAEILQRLQAALTT